MERVLRGWHRRPLQTPGHGNEPILTLASRDSVGALKM